MTLVAAMNTILAALSLAQTNSWITPSDGKWEKAKNWSEGLPSLTQSAVVITNAGDKVITIDRHTVNKSPESLTISNFVINSAGNTNTLFLSNTGTISLNILNSLTVSNGSILSSTRSALSAGTLVAAGSVTFTDDSQMSAESLIIGDGYLGENESSIFLTGGSHLSANVLTVGDGFFFENGSLTISNSFVDAGDVVLCTPQPLGVSGIIEIIGGAMTVSGSLIVNNGDGDGDFTEPSGAVVVSNGGQLVATNGEIYVAAGFDCIGSITVSNATLLGSGLRLGGERSHSTLSINNGTVTLNAEFDVGIGVDSGGEATLAGGILTVTNAPTVIGGESGQGGLEIDDGQFRAREIEIGAEFQSVGAMTINGGTVLLTSYLQVGSGGEGSGQMDVNGGQVTVTNGDVIVGASECCEPALINVSGGLLTGNYFNLGVLNARFVSDIAGTLEVNDGSVTALTGITLGDCRIPDFGYLTVSGGQVILTNAAGTCFLDVRDGMLSLNGGTLTVDQLVLTNECGSFNHTGGHLSAGSIILDPNEFRITAITREGNDIRVTWMMGPGQTNALQAAVGGIGGRYATNGFTDIFVVTNNTTLGVITNFLDIGVATNGPTRYYRARLAP